MVELSKLVVNWLGGDGVPFKYILPSLAALFGASWAYRVNIRNKRFDVIISCNQRYDLIYQDRLKIPARAKYNAAVRQYYRRYWGLKSDQFEYWLAGGVDPQTFANWFFSTLLAFRQGRRVGMISFEKAWERERGDQEAVNSSFVDFVDAIIEIARKPPFYTDDELAEGRFLFAHLLYEMHVIESREGIFNDFLFDRVPRFVRGRLTVRRLVRTLPAQLQQVYLKIERSHDTRWLEGGLRTLSEMST